MRWLASPLYGFVRLIRYVADPKIGLSLIALAVSLAWVGIGAWQGEHQIYAPGPLARSHQNIDCQTCHVQPWHALGRLFAHDSRKVRQVMDQACIACHQGLVHQNTEVPAAVPNCVSCHREHKGPHGLAQVADRQCTSCHEDLKTTTGPSTQFALHLNGFGDHPEFRAVRKPNSDPGELQFNHVVHLNPAGIRGVDGKAVQLKCSACHEPAAGGATMKPIRFEAHCRSCHASALVFDHERFPGEPAPHGIAPRLLRGWLQEHYREGGVPSSTMTISFDWPIPKRTTPQSDAEAVRSAMAANNAMRVLFQHSGGCRYCHQVQATANEWLVAPTNLTPRWLPHAKFDHFAHRHLSGSKKGEDNCLACHDAARTSTKTSEVLLPSVQKCRECHVKSRGSQHAATDCINCHVYHNHIAGRR